MSKFLGCVCVFACVCNHLLKWSLFISDIDECSLVDKVCKKKNENCYNTPGSFVCVCPDGSEETEDACIQKTEGGEWQKARGSAACLPRDGANQTLGNYQIRNEQIKPVFSAHPGSWRRRTQQEYERGQSRGAFS